MITISLINIKYNFIYFYNKKIKWSNYLLFDGLNNKKKEKDKIRED